MRSNRCRRCSEPDTDTWARAWLLICFHMYMCISLYLSLSLSLSLSLYLSIYRSLSLYVYIYIYIYIRTCSRLFHRSDRIWKTKTECLSRPAKLPKGARPSRRLRRGTPRRIAPCQDIAIRASLDSAPNRWALLRFLERRQQTHPNRPRRRARGSEQAERRVGSRGGGRQPGSHIHIYIYIYIYIPPEVLKSGSALILRAGSYF